MTHTHTPNTLTHTQSHAYTVHTAMTLHSERAANHPVTREEQQEPSNLVEDNHWSYKFNEMANNITLHTFHFI